GGGFGPGGGIGAGRRSGGGSGRAAERSPAPSDGGTYAARAARANCGRRLAPDHRPDADVGHDLVGQRRRDGRQASADGDGKVGGGRRRDSEREGAADFLAKAERAGAAAGRGRIAPSPAAAPTYARSA